MHLVIGAKKSVALRCIVNALKKLESTLKVTGTVTPSEQDTSSQSLLTGELRSLFGINETVTTARLADQLCANDGVYLNLIDEIEGLFDSLDGKGRETLDRRLWLSLNTGSQVTRSTRHHSTVIEDTRLNYTGEFMYAIHNEFTHVT